MHSALESLVGEKKTTMTVTTTSAIIITTMTTTIAISRQSHSVRGSP